MQCSGSPSQEFGACTNVIQLLCDFKTCYKKTESINLTWPCFNLMNKFPVFHGPHDPAVLFSVARQIFIHSEYFYMQINSKLSSYTKIGVDPILLPRVFSLPPVNHLTDHAHLRTHPIEWPYEHMCQISLKSVQWFGPYPVVRRTDRRTTWLHKPWLGLKSVHLCSGTDAELLR